MMEPCCAVCGETKISDLYMFNYGVCLCHRCLEISAHSFIHDNSERRLKENKEKVISVEGLPKAEHESMTEFKDRLRREVEASIETKMRAESEAKRNAKAAQEVQIKMADLSIENNRLRTGLKDLKEEYESFRERTSRVWWGVAVAGFAIGTLVTLMFLNPR